MTIKILARKPEGNRPLRSPRHRCEDDVRMELRGKRVGICGLDSSSSG
jgi:hypothetical protein